jgi:hypothetical protein
MEQFTGWIIDWMNLMIPGFVYLFAIFFLLQSFTDDAILNRLKKAGRWLP